MEGGNLMSDAHDNVQDHLNNAIFGGLQTKPDERRHYLGSLRERVALRITNDEMTEEKTQRRFRQAIQDYRDQPEWNILLNGKLGIGTTSPYMKLCRDNDVPFTLINDGNAQLDPDEAGLLIVAKNAIDRPDSDIALPDLPEPKAPKGFFGRLFQ